MIRGVWTMRWLWIAILSGPWLLACDWRSDDPIALRYATPEIDPGAASVNTEIELSVPEDRWVLFVGGPRLGPAILFWSLLLVATLLALGLGRLPLTPLGWGSWMLLFVGLTQIPVWASLFVVGWLLALGWRRANAAAASIPAAAVLITFISLLLPAFRPDLRHHAGDVRRAFLRRTRHT